MIYFGIAACIIFFIISVLRHKSVYNPAALFNFVWLLILLLRSLNMYSMYEYSKSTMLLIVVGILFFNIGSFLGSFKKISGRSRFKESNSIFNILTAVTIALLAFTSISSFLLILKGANIWDIRYTLRDEVLKGDVIDILYNYFCFPMSFLIIHTNMYRVFAKRKRILNLIVIIFVILASILTEGGRFILLYAGIDLIILLLMSKRLNPMPRKTTKKMKIIVFLGCTAALLSFVYITLRRDADIFKTIYTYTCGCVNLFDTKVQEFDGNYYYGLISIYGFIRPVFTVLKAIGIISTLPSNVSDAGNILLDVEKMVLIGPDIEYNGFVSNFYAFYLDGGMIGVIAFSFLYGLICLLAYRKMLACRDEFHIVAFLFIAQALLTSMLKLQFVAFNFTMGIVYLFVSYAPSLKKQCFSTISKSLLKSK